MKKLFFLFTLLTFQAMAVVVEYKLPQGHYIVDVDGVTKDGEFHPFGNDSIQLVAVKIKVESKSREVGNCIEVKRYEYLRSIVIPTWDNTTYKFCPNRVLVEGKYYNLKKDTDLKFIISFLNAVTKPRQE
jgi:hypothetical protein